MSKYTTEVRFICETASGLSESVGANSVDEVIANAVDKVFNFNFPIFDEAYRKTLESKILKHYYTREIAFETVGLWKLKLNSKLNEIMPYYNKLYKSELIEFNPLYSDNLTREHTGKNTRNNTGSEHSVSDTETNNTNIVDGESHLTSTNSGSDSITTGRTSKYSDTPQGTISNLEGDTYLTNATIDSESDSTTYGKITQDDTTNDVTTTNNGTGKITTDGSTTFDEAGTDHYLETVVGYSGKNPSKSLMEYRDTFLNIDMMIINECKDLFFTLW